VGGTVTTEIDKAIAYNGGKLVLNKTSGEIGVTHKRTMLQRTSYKARLHGRKFFVSVSGERAVQVKLTDLRGRLIALRTISAGGSSAVAQRLAAGMYCVEYTFDNFTTINTSLLVP
jgi:hypothetical protein